MVKRNIFIFIVFLFLLKDVLSSQEIYTLNLKEAIEMALKNNKRLLSSKERVNAAFLQIKESSSKLHPQLDLKAGLHHTKFLDKRKYIQENFTQTFEEPYRITSGIHLSQVLFDGKKTITEIKRAKENLKEVEVEYELLKQALIAEVAEAYYNLVKIKKRKEAYQKEKERTKELYDIISAKLREGLVAEADEKRARLNLTEAEGRVTLAKNAEQIAQEHLKRLLGLPFHSLVNTQERLPEFKPIEFEPDAAISKALDNNLEIKKAQINLNKEIFSKKIAQSLYWPQVTIDANYSWEGINKTFKRSIDKFQEYQWSVSLNIMLPIFDGGYRKSQLRQAESSFNEARIELEKIKENIIFNIKEKAIKLKEIQERIIMRQNSLILAQENLQIVEAKYREGRATLKEVFEENKILTEIFIDYIEALCDYEVYKIKFYILTGQINACF